MSVIYKTVDEIRQDMLNNISSDYEKSKGNPTYDIPAAVAIVLKKMYDRLQELNDKVDVDKLFGEELARYVRQRRGVKKKQATKAKVDALTIVGNATINSGDLFETQSGTQFSATETVIIFGAGSVKVEAVIPGPEGNVGANTITLMPITLQGVTSVTNPEPSYDGFAEETDESLRERYKEITERPPTSNNIFHYMVWAKEVAGVGDSRVLPLWDGDNTVKVVIINADKQPASGALVGTVQEYIDPMGIYIPEEDSWTLWGKGAGTSSLGAYCTVVSAAGKAINISADVQEEEGFTPEEAQANMENSITEYLKKIAFKQNYVSYALLGSEIINTEGVADYQNLLINGVAVNIDIGTEEVAILGTVTIT